MAKVCPKCHASQSDGVEFCPTDGSRLQALPAQPSKLPTTGSEADRQFQSTLMGVGGDQAQKLAAALQSKDDNEADATMAFDVSALRQGAPALKPVDGFRPAPPPPPQKTIPPMQRPAGLAPKPVPVAPRPVSTAVPAPVPHPAPARPASTAAPASAAVAPTAATTLAKLIETSGALPTNLAVGRVCDVAELLGRGRPATPVTPAHIGYGDTTGSGKPRWTEPAGLDPAYLAQYRPPDLDQGATAATDAYILACVLFEALTGKPPFRGKTVEEIARKQAMAAAPAVRQIKTDCDLPPSLEIELQRALKKRPGDRHPSLAAFADGIRNAVREDDRSTTALDVSEVAYLQELLQGGQAPAPQSKAPPRVPTAPVKAVVPPAAAPARAAPAPAPVAPSAPAPAPAAPNRTGLYIGVAIVVAAALGAGVFLATHGDKTEPPPAVKAPEPPPPEQPDVVQTPDVQPDIQPDIPPDVPDVQPDVAPDIALDIEKPKVKQLPHKPDVKAPDVKVEPKIEPKQEKKPDINRPPVF